MYFLNFVAKFTNRPANSEMNFSAIQRVSYELRKKVRNLAVKS